jgi:DnaJ-class molecular chaperone
MKLMRAFFYIPLIASTLLFAGEIKRIGDPSTSTRPQKPVITIGNTQQLRLETNKPIEKITQTGKQKLISGDWMTFEQEETKVQTYRDGSSHLVIQKYNNYKEPQEWTTTNGDTIVGIAIKFNKTKLVLKTDTKDVDIPRALLVPDCQAILNQIESNNAHNPMVECPMCDGTGKTRKRIDKTTINVDCPFCKGNSRVRQKCAADFNNMQSNKRVRYENRYR